MRNLIATWIALVLVATQTVWGQGLPVTSYSAADGLPGGAIWKITRDAHGFLWFCSNEGVARFDGHAFIQFGAETGLPTGRVHDLLEQADQVCQDLGQNPRVADDPVTRGFGDANFFAHLIPTVDGLGADGDGVHGPHEFLNVKSLVPSTTRAAVLISRLLKQAR